MKIVNLLSIVCLLLLSTMLYADGNVGNIVRDVQGAPYAIFKCSASLPILKWDTTLTPPRFKCAADATGSSGYTTIQEEGSDLAAESKLNFIGSLITCVDDAGNTRTNCTVTGDGVGYDEVLEEGSGLTKRAKLNFIGGSVTCVDNSGNTRTDCTFTDGVGYDRIKDEGSDLTQRATVNFIGPGVSCIDNSGSTRTDCTIAGGNGQEGPPWAAIRHYAYIKFPQTTRTTMNWGGAVPDFSWTRDSAAGAPSVTPNKEYVYAMITTTGAASNGFRFTVGSNTGYASFNNRPVVHYHFWVLDSAGTDSTKYKVYASMNNSANNAANDYAYAGAIAMGCTTGNNTITSLGSNLGGFILACWDKNAQANVQACSSTEVTGAGNGTLVCVDTGIAAPASNTEIDIALDFLDSSNAKVWVNGVATTLSSNLPTANVRMVQKAIGIRTTAATTGIELVLMNADEWWD